MSVITVENLSKRYLVGHQEPKERYLSLRDIISRHGRNFARKTIDMARGRQIIQGDEVEEFWALKELSFEVNRGEVLGIIGPNGAGKSTLLKILSRITEPTGGRAVIKGRVASLLEVGTGFHPELTGRENIFLNGAIIGMAKTEIRNKFDEIVAFAGVEKFLDTPVKRYSSGMYMRLAFAVAAHLEPEILVIDEVLAVGDSDFQKKCLGKIKNVVDGGRTVLFVSHNMGAIATLCHRGLLLKEGAIQYSGPVTQAIQLYSEQGIESANNNIPMPLGKHLNLTEFSLSPNPVKSGSGLKYKLQIESSKPVQFEGLSILIYSSQGVRVGIVDLRQADSPLAASPNLSLELSGSLQLPNLVEGTYSIGLFIYCPLFGNNVLDISQLSVTQDHTSSLMPHPASERGLVEFKSK